MADLPGMVQNTGTPTSSAKVRNSSVAPANNTPAPAQMTGFLAFSNAVTASSMSPWAGCCRAALGDT